MTKGMMIFFLLGFIACAKVSVETKKPIKVDISMRIDVYQHVIKDVESIEGQIFGNTEKQMNFLWGIKEVFAAEMPSEVKNAIERRKQRVADIEDYFTKGYVGLNKNAYVEIRSVSKSLESEVEAAISEENRDRKITYSYTAEKNGVELSQVEEVVFKDHFKRAPAGYWFQMYDEDRGEYIWKQK